MPNHRWSPLLVVLAASAVSFMPARANDKASLATLWRVPLAVLDYAAQPITSRIQESVPAPSRPSSQSTEAKAQPVRAKGDTAGAVAPTQSPTKAPSVSVPAPQATKPTTRVPVGSPTVAVVAPTGDLDALQQKALEDRVYDLLREVLNEGADLYNAPSVNPTACSYLFLGSLRTVERMLVHRPELQEKIRRGVADAQRIKGMDPRAWALREVIDTVRKDLRPPAVMGVGQGNTLWERLGGKPNVERIINDCVIAAIADPRVNFFRNGSHKLTPEQLTELKKKLVLLTSAATGGPDKYSGKSVKEAHRGMGITDAEFDALLVHLRIALVRNGIKDPKDVAAITEAAAVVRADIVQPVQSVQQPKGMEPPKSLWERLGGEDKVRKVVSDWVDASIADPKVDFFRGGQRPMTAAQIADMKQKIVALASAVGGGPYKYEGMSMREVHKGMGITDGQFDAVIGHLRAAMLRHEVNKLDIFFIIQAISARRPDIVESR